ncbi:serine--tRNA synthetase-like protein Slimp isoform X1 [Lycorma delicatula]|uniref:serine--tRNA synthetase-like protein Slimp isoform X1 n=1 Tax=Lycorma delicatula TaxID=130591 RepID=UPI003F5168B6
MRKTCIVKLNYISYKYFSSFLYVTGDKARDIYSSVQPHIDFDERIQNINELDNNIKKRCINIDIYEIKRLWDFYRTRLDFKHKLEVNKKEILLNLHSVSSEEYSDDNKRDDEIKALKLKSEMIKDDLKNITRTVWEIENNVILKVLQIPNDLHPRTPDKEVIIDNINKKFDYGFDHLEIGKNLNCLDYHNKSSYYLKNDLALFEIAVGQYFCNRFKTYKYIPFCNADFARSVLVEGCTLKNHAPDVGFILKNTEKNQKHKVYLSGGASFLPFFGFHTKHIIEGKYLPVRYVAQGRQYNPLSVQNLNGLYSAWQSTAVEIFTCMNDDAELTEEFDHVVSILLDIYSSLDLHFRTTYVPASKLKSWERLRVNFQVYSPVNKMYVEIGNISLIGNYISKRLLAYYSNSNESALKFLNVISGTALRIPVLIANLLENSSTELFIPKVIKDEMIF